MSRRSGPLALAGASGWGMIASRPFRCQRHCLQERIVADGSLDDLGAQRHQNWLDCGGYGAWVRGKHGVGVALSQALISRYHCQRVLAIRIERQQIE